MDIKRLLTTLGLLGLLIFSMLSLYVITQDDNSATVRITDNELINQTYRDLQTDLSSGAAQTASDDFGRVTPTFSLGELTITSIFGITKVAKTILIGLWNIIVVLPMSILGVSPLVANILGSLLLIFIVIGVWAVWKGAIS